MAADTMSSVELVTEADVDAFARSCADEVHDPCSMAIGLNVGLAEMGLIRCVTVEPVGDGWAVDVTLRLTSPGCQYFFFFQEQLEAKLAEHPGVTTAKVSWDQLLDWTPEDMAPSAKAKIQHRQMRLHPLPKEASTGRERVAHRQP